MSRVWGVSQLFSCLQGLNAAPVLLPEPNSWTPSPPSGSQGVLWGAIPSLLQEAILLGQSAVSCQHRFRQARVFLLFSLVVLAEKRVWPFWMECGKYKVWRGVRRPRGLCHCPSPWNRVSEAL